MMAPTCLEQQNAEEALSVSNAYLLKVERLLTLIQKHMSS